MMEQADRPIVPIVVIGELIAGFRNGNHLKRNVDELDAFRGTIDVQLEREPQGRHCPG